MRRPWLSLACALVPSLAAAQVPASMEFRVNTYTTGQQTTLLSVRTVAAAPNGDFVVTWSGDGPSGPGVFAQRFDAAGTRLGAEIEAGSGFASDATVATEPGGGFLVGWMDSGPEIYVRRFDRNGVPTLGPFRVNTYVGGSQEAPSIAVDARRGDFVLAWTSDGQDGDSRGIFAQQFDASGAPRGPEFQVNSYSVGAQSSARVAITGEPGGFVAAWLSQGQDGDGGGVFAQRFIEGGAPVGPEFPVNSFTTGNQFVPRLASAADGSFVIAWASDGQYMGNQLTGIYAQRYSADGDPVGGEFRVSTYTASWKSMDDVAMDPSGNFVVTWTSEGQDGSLGGVYARRFDSNGVPRGPEFRVNTTSAQIQAHSSAALDSAGNLFVDWVDWGILPAHDEDVYAKRYGGLLPTALAVDAAAGPSSNGNRVFEAGESVVIAPTWRNVNGAAQTFSGTASVFTGPGLPGNPTYTIADGAADYGTVANGAAAPCGATGNCYELAISTASPRPAPHWDATLREDLLPINRAQTKLWSLHVGGTFADVPQASSFYRFVETIVHAGITAGCGGSSYCPAAATTREQMAVFVLLANERSAYLPPACGATPLFADVPVSSPFCRWVEELARRGSVTGCGGGNYCPSASVTREQMAVFVLRVLDPALSPPPCATAPYADVPATSSFCRWILELTNRGVVSGCGGGNYCPAAPVTREQMSVFLSVTFGLTLYGP